MSELPGVLNLLAPFFGLVAIGFACARAARQPQAALGWIQFFLIYVSLPALLFRLIADKPVDQLLNWRFVAATTLATAAAFSLSFALGYHASEGDPAEAVVQGVAGSYANIGYMGPPLVLGALGPEAGTPVILVLVFDNLFLFTTVPLLMAFAGRGGRGVFRTGLRIVRRVLTHPFNMAAMAGLLVGATHSALPTALDRMVGWLSQAAAPTALFLLGVVVGSGSLGRLPAGVPALVAVKLLVHPLLALAFLLLVGFSDPTWIAAATIMAALPPALNLFVIASQYGVGIERASACVLLGTAFSAVTVTAAIWLIKTGHLPAAAPLAP